jgi:membrane protease YdiL (CAAX protease family)
VERARAMFWMAVAFEGGLGLAALGAGALLGHSPAVGFEQRPGAALLIGCLAALPLVGLLALTERLPFAWLRELRRLAEELLPELFPKATRLQLLLVSLAAGFGEELLFRGLLQAGLARWVGGELGTWIGLAVASALFGLAHPISRAYAVVATVIGVYFGGLMLLTGNVLAPVAAHALYDFLALQVLTRGEPGSGAGEPAAPGAVEGEPPGAPGRDQEPEER